MLRVEEKMGAPTEDGEPLLVFGRLVGGALAVPVVGSVPLVDIVGYR